MEALRSNGHYYDLVLQLQLNGIFAFVKYLPGRQVRVSLVLAGKVYHHPPPAIQRDGMLVVKAKVVAKVDADLAGASVQQAGRYCQREGWI